MGGISLIRIGFHYLLFESLISGTNFGFNNDLFKPTHNHIRLYTHGVNSKSTLFSNALANTGNLYSILLLQTLYEENIFIKNMESEFGLLDPFILQN